MIGRLLGSHVTVTIKEDGTPLTVVLQDNGKYGFYKKGSSFTSPGDEITKIDEFLNIGYGKPLEYLKDKMKDVSFVKKFRKATILNFEIVTKNDYHLIQPSVYPQHDVYLLNAYESNGKEIPLEMENSISGFLGISRPERLMDGYATDEFIKNLVQLVKEYGDPKKMHDDVDDIVSKFSAIIPDKSKIPYTDDNNGNHEGIVFDFLSSGKHLMLKIDDHVFTNGMISRKTDEDNSDGKKKFDDLVDAFCEIVTSKNYIYGFGKYSNDPLENLAFNFDRTFGNCYPACRYISDMYKHGGEVITYMNTQMLPDSIRRKTENNEYLLSLRCFIWIFSKRRKDMEKQNILFDRINGKS